jgi:hypothetical protein
MAFVSVSEEIVLKGDFIMRTWRQLLWLALPALCVMCVSTTAAEDETASFVPVPTTMRSHIHFDAGGKTAAIYRFGHDLAKPILWPLTAPNGKEITRAWPLRTDIKGESTDHKHQKSAWFTYGDVIPEGIEIKHKRKGVEGIDFWAEEKDCGRIICVRTLSISAGDIVGIHTENEWRTPEGVPILTENRMIRFGAYETARLIVVDINLHANVAPITFGDTKEGAFGVRVADSMTEKKGKGRITNAEGKTGMLQCWGRISDWCDYSGPVEGEIAGIAIFAAPTNPLPTCWHSRDYGLMAANPFGRAKSGFPAMKDRKDLVRLDKGEHLKLRYGIFVHMGDVKHGKVAEAYEQFKKIK